MDGIIAGPRPGTRGRVGDVSDIPKPAVGMRVQADVSLPDTEIATGLWVEATITEIDHARARTTVRTDRPIEGRDTFEVDSMRIEPLPSRRDP